MDHVIAALWTSAPRSCALVTALESCAAGGDCASSEALATVERNSATDSTKNKFTVSRALISDM
jgi:hypothetical protein